MNSNLPKALVVAVAVSILWGASAGRADVLSTNTSTTEISSPAYPVTWLTFGIDQFNPALGTLNSVQLTVSGQVEASLYFTNNDGNVGLKVEIDPTYQIAYFNGSLTNLLVDDESIDWTTPGFPKSVSVPADGTYFYSWGPANEGPVTQNLTLAPDLANFTGSGLIPVAAQLSCTTMESIGGGNYTISAPVSGSATAQVIYDYIPVPEPSTIGLVVVGLLGGLGMIRRRK
jgi:hypothetical protein